MKKEHKNHMKLKKQSISFTHSIRFFKKNQSIFPVDFLSKFLNVFTNFSINF